MFTTEFELGEILKLFTDRLIIWTVRNSTANASPFSRFFVRMRGLWSSLLKPEDKSSSCDTQMKAAKQFFQVVKYTYFSQVVLHQIV